MNSVAERIKQLLAVQLNMETEDIGDLDDLQDDLGAESMDLLDVMLAAEREFHISLSDEDVQDLHTVRQITRYINCILCDNEQ